MSKSREYELKLPARIVWNSLFEPKPYVNPKTKKAQGDPKYQTTILLDPTSPDLLAMQAITKEIAKEHNADFKATAFPFKNGDKLADALLAQQKNGDYYRGKVVIRTDSKSQPQLGVFKGGVIANGVIELNSPATISQYKSQFYSGVDAIVVINLSWYDAVGEDGKPGVKAYLNAVISTGKGEQLGRKSLSERFKGVAGVATEEDPTAGLDDEIPY